MPQCLGSTHHKSGLSTRPASTNGEISGTVSGEGAEGGKGKVDGTANLSRLFSSSSSETLRVNILLMASACNVIRRLEKYEIEQTKITGTQHTSLPILEVDRQR